MSMWTPLRPALAASCGLVLLPAPAVSNAPPCGPATGAFLTTATTRVFAVARTKPRRSTQVYACERGWPPIRLALYKGRAPRQVARLLNPSVRRVPFDAYLAGQFVAYRLTWTPFNDGRQGVTQGLVVRSLRTGTTVFRTGLFTSDADRFLTVESFVLTSSGAIAWIQDVPSGADEGRRVMAADAAGRHVLDSGLQIDANSLRLSGHTVSWTSGGESRTASLA